jgi:hypothetical protein
MHNAINRHLEKPEMPLAAAGELWKGTRGQETAAAYRRALAEAGKSRPATGLPRRACCPEATPKRPETSAKGKPS